MLLKNVSRENFHETVQTHKPRKKFPPTKVFHNSTMEVKQAYCLLNQPTISNMHSYMH